ncbi:MAG TPA: crosslink repair DNA glycosylase YcaQ family protein [Candidatus Dormibacteraeota bacterium]
MDLTARLRAWTHGRQGLGDPARSPAAALRVVVAVYSAHPTAPLALAARTVRMSAEDFRRLERRRAALRIPAMRGSLFLAPAESAGRTFTPFILSSAHLATRLRRGGMSAEEYAVVADRVVAAATEPLLPKQLHDVAGVSGLGMSILLRTIRGQGRLLAVSDGSLRVATLRYVATESWAPGSLDVADASAALSDLAGEYLHAYGPARIADFAWWTGLARGTAARALGAHDTIDVGEGLLLPAADESAFTAVKRLTGSVDLLPKWDPYTMGHAPEGRGRLVHPANQAAIYVQKGVVAPGQPNMGLPGDGYPVVLVDGEAVGTWSLTLKGATVELFDTMGPRVERRLDERLDETRALLSG